MATHIEYMDSFDLVTDFAKSAGASFAFNKWRVVYPTGVISTAAARTGPHGLLMTTGGVYGEVRNDNTYHYIDGTGYHEQYNPSIISYDYFGAGQALRNPTGIAAVGNPILFQWTLYNNAETLEIKADSNNGLTFTSTTGISATSAPNILPASGWFYIEVLSRVSNTVGDLEVRVNQTPVFILSGLDTRGAAANTAIGTGRLGAPANWHVDDIYISNSNLQVDPASFINPIKIYALHPIAAGPYPIIPPWQSWEVIGAGAAWDAVNEIGHDVDATYLRAPFISGQVLRYRADFLMESLPQAVINDPTRRVKWAQVMVSERSEGIPGPARNWVVNAGIGNAQGDASIISAGYGFVHDTGLGLEDYVLEHYTTEGRPISFTGSQFPANWDGVIGGLYGVLGTTNSATEVIRVTQFAFELAITGGVTATLPKAQAFIMG